MIRKIYMTGDKHGSFDGLIDWADSMGRKLSKDDVVIVLGDAGINYFLNIKDYILKERLKNLPFRIICLHGNHEERPCNIPSYKLQYVEDLHCECWMEDDFPNLIFPKDGMMTINGKKFLLLGGAYSVDKFLRKTYGWPWFESEQMSDEAKEEIRELIKHENRFDYVLSHTAPIKYEPRHLFLKNLNQDLIDKSMETFLDEIEENISYKAWLFGHYHADERLGTRVWILYRDIRPLSDFDSDE